jgi:hypothetical protein
MPDNLLRQLCENKDPSITQQIVDMSGMEDITGRLIQMKALKQGIPLDIVMCPDCFETHDLAVESDGNGKYSGYCQEAGYVDVPREALSCYELSFDWLLQQINMAIGLSLAELPAPIEGIEQNLWFLGRQRIEQRPFNVYFTRRLHDSSVTKPAQEYLFRNQSDLPTFVITTSSVDSVVAALPKRVILLNLFEVMTFRNGRLILDESIFTLKLKGESFDVVTDGVSQYFSADFRSAMVDGIRYTFSKNQAAIMEKLIESDGSAHKDALSAAADSSQSPSGIFRSRGKYHPAWDVLIKPRGDGFYYCPLYL